MAAGKGKSGGAAFWLWILLGTAVLIADQVIKHFAERLLEPGAAYPVTGFFNLALAHNRGAAFSFLAEAGGWQRWALAALALAVTAGLLALLYRSAGKKLFSLSVTLIVAGALGNMLDRALWGYVIDFIDLHAGGWHWPAFNIADIAICAGAAGLVVDELIGASKR